MSDIPRNDLTRGFAEAIADIRNKVVEEPWFGRAVTEPPRTLDVWSSLPSGPAPAEPGTVAPEGWLRAPRIGPAEPKSPTTGPDHEPDL